MTTRFRRTSPAHEDVSLRLSQIGMPEYQRLIAEAHLARAEAIAELLAAAAKTIKSLAKALVVRPIRRALAHIG